MSDFDCVEVLKAQHRQVNHERARLMATMVEVGLCDEGPADVAPRMAAPDEFSADEIRAALVLTGLAANAQFWLAYDLITRLPAVHAAMDAGALDEPRARVLSEWTTELSVEQARALCEELLPRVPGLTTGQLIEGNQETGHRHRLGVGPAPLREAVAECKVVGYRNPDGSANLSGYNLLVDQVAAASGHIDALAKAVKRAGDPRPIDHIRADLFLGMTDGSYTGLDDAEIINQLLAAGQRDEPEDQGQHPTGEGRSGEDSNDRAQGQGGYAAPVDAQGRPVPTVSGGAGRELRVRLSTLLGHDQYPAELAGWELSTLSWPGTSPSPSAVSSGASRSPTGTVASAIIASGQAKLMRRRPSRVSAPRSGFAGFRFRVSRTLKGA
ncbi:MAG: 13E12 repeat family protein [Actinomycetota bacterium]|nr:13E12 repeat family protein [Actinomycetota bacterium]